METKKLTIKCAKNKSFKWETEINDSAEAARFARHFYHDDIVLYESFFIIMCKANYPVAWAKIAQGGCASTQVDIKILAKYVIDSLARNVILVHNHPSGSLQPSTQDKLLTKRIKQAMQLFDVRVLDHIILSEKDYYSFNDNHIL